MSACATEPAPSHAPAARAANTVQGCLIRISGCAPGRRSGCAPATSARSIMFDAVPSLRTIHPRRRRHFLRHRRILVLVALAELVDPEAFGVVAVAPLVDAIAQRVVVVDP